MKTIKIKVNDTWKEIKVTDESFEKLEEIKDNKRWKPEEHKMYWYIGSDGFVYQRTWIADAFDINRYDLGNVFKTEEEAQFEVDKRLFLVKAHDWARENDLDEDKYYYIAFYKDVINKEYVIYEYLTDANLKTILPAFSSKEIALDFIEEFKDDIMKYLVGVEE